MSASEVKQALVVAVQHGNVVAFDRLLRVSQTDARRYARRHCQSSDIDDAVQETLLILTRRIQTLKKPAAFAAWLFTVVRRECDRLSRAMFRGDSLEDAHVEACLACKSDEGLRHDLSIALESLPAHYLEVILMRDFEEMTISEMAAALSEEAGAIKSRLHRARALVREYLLTPGAALIG